MNASSESRPSILPGTGFRFPERLLVCLGFLLGMVQVLGAEEPIPQRFNQEVARHRELTNGLPAGPVQLIEIGPDGSPQVFVSHRWWRFTRDRWEWMFGVPESGPDVFQFPDGNGAGVRVPIPGKEVRQLLRRGDIQYVVTSTEVLRVDASGATPTGWASAPGTSQPQQLAVSPEGELWLGSATGLFRRTAAGWEPFRAADSQGRIWGADAVAGAAFDKVGRLWIATRAGAAALQGDRWITFEGHDGLPWNDFTGITPGAEGILWFGTRLGVIRYDSNGWHYRQGPTWLPSDEVTQIAVTVHGAAWFATPAGVGAIERKFITLSEKAALYETEIDRHIRRTAFGYVAEAPLTVAGDRSTASPVDSDNDGLWTAMYGAGECFAWGALGDPAAKKRARKAFEALRFLQTVTQGGTPSPPPGYVARTVLPIESPDPNRGRREADEQIRQWQDSMWKVYEPRWPKSADGRWYWKSDTSSDELDGHYFFYAQYFDLCAETPEEKAEVAAVVRSLTDHLVTHQFALVDVDGTPTRWAVFGPEALNRDPRWWVERGINSLSLLSYLAVAEKVTGDAKYGKVSRELIDLHGYAQNAMFPKVEAGIGSGNQSDDEMAVMAFYTLLRHSKDEGLKAMIRLSCQRFWLLEQPEMNPFFNFAYAAVNQGQTATNQWGRIDLSPGPGWLEDSAATLRGFPLDRILWPAKNSHRLDVVRLPRQNSINVVTPDTRPRGWRVNQKVLPVENRSFTHWNTDPWTLDYGGDGRELGAGTVFLLPYYMGLYHGYILRR